jgi:hypothetical protein
MEKEVSDDNYEICSACGRNKKDRNKETGKLECNY